MNEASIFVRKCIEERGSFIANNDIVLVHVLPSRERRITIPTYMYMYLRLAECVWADIRLQAI